MITNSSQPLISVITPAYNHEKYIEETIRSVIGQTYRNLEYLILDDGSADRTWQIINKLKPLCEKRFTRFVCKSWKNAGTAKTQDWLLENARGEYIYCLASDDIAKPQAIEKLYHSLSADPQNVLAVADNEIIDGESKRISWDAKRQIRPFGQGYDSFGNYLKKMRPDVDFGGANFGSYKTLLAGNYLPNGILMRARAIAPYTPEAPLEDWYQWLQLSKKGKFVYLDEILFSYRWHANNTIRNIAHINELSKKTFMYEQKLLEKEEFRPYAEIFDEFFNQGYKKTSFRLGNFMEIYRCKSPLFNKKFLRLFNKVWCLSCKIK